MLRRLRIRDFALLDAVDVEFGPGLNVLTGETGAGKSILIDSLSLLLGARASVDAIRSGADAALLEALFEYRDEEVAVRREIRRDRSSRVEIDGDLSTVRMLRTRCSALAQLHGQHEDVLLTRRDRQRALLDAFAGSLDLAARTREAVRRLAEIDARIEAASATRDERVRRLESIEREYEEIERAQVQPREDDTLEETLSLLNSALERQRLASEICAAIDGDEGCLEDRLTELQRAVDALIAHDESLGSLANRVDGLRVELRDIALEIERYGTAIESDPARAAEVESRLAELERLRRRYGPTLEDVVSRSRAVALEIEQLESERAKERGFGEERDEAVSALTALAGELSDAREAGARRLESAVEERLAGLGIGDGCFRVELERSPEEDGIVYRGECFAITGAGLETVEFRIAPNPGEGLRPLSRIASGGELSRVVLAIKAALAEADETPTLVFDEIDAGIGGEVAHRVAQELQSVSRHHQVIVVTHLAQIAAAADRHIVVEKRVEKGRTVSVVTPVDGETRVHEISRLLSGDPERAIAREHAQALLEEVR